MSAATALVGERGFKPLRSPFAQRQYRAWAWRVSFDGTSGAGR
jgi:hypothetical protein